MAVTGVDDGSPEVVAAVGATGASAATGLETGWLRSIRRYRQLALITTAGICFLVVAGGAVRLTGSGLGCDDWPSCNSERFIDVSTGHTAIEQLNRLLSGVIGVPTLLLVIAAFRVRPRTPGLRWPAIGVLLTVLANGVVGGMAVRSDLHPALVQSHFLLAMVSISFGVVAMYRADRSGRANGRTFVRPSSVVQRLALAVGFFTATALVTGTIVTGTGPHAGDEEARRFGFDISNVTRTHSIAVLSALVMGLVLASRIHRRDADATYSRGEVTNALSAWIFVGMLQAVVGYTQYFTGVPELLVGAHIALATALWVMTMRVVLMTSMSRVNEQVFGYARQAPVNA